MNLYPAVDLLGGKCVRLTQGLRDQCTVYYDDPAVPAQKWIDAGTKWLHVIDLDAALDARCFANREAIERILAVAKANGVRVQVGGGIRKAEDIQAYLGMGISRVIVGTKALQSREFAREIFGRFKEKVAISIDSKDDKVALRGWQDVTDVPTQDAVAQMRDDGVKVIIITDIRSDGGLKAPNVEMVTATSLSLSPFMGDLPAMFKEMKRDEMLSNIANTEDIEIIVAGGVTLVEHVDHLVSMGKKNIAGAIIGKALYEGKFDLAEAARKYPQE